MKIETIELPGEYTSAIIPEYSGYYEQSEDWKDGYRTAIREVAERLHAGIEAAKKKHKYSCLNQSMSAQCAVYDQVVHLEYAMALAANTVRGEMILKSLIYETSIR